MAPASSNDASSKLVSCLAYSACSLSIVLSNKMLTSSFKRDKTQLPDQTYSLGMLAFQAFCATTVLLLAHIFAPERNERGEAKPINMSVTSLLAWLPVNLAFTAMLFTGFVSLGHNSVPMVTLFKNLTNVFTVSGDWYFQGSTVSAGVIGSLLLMLMGAFLSAWSDLEFQPLGYMWMLANCLTTATYVLYLSRVINSQKKHKEVRVILQKFRLVI